MYRSTGRSDGFDKRWQKQTRRPMTSSFVRQERSFCHIMRMQTGVSYLVPVTLTTFDDKDRKWSLNYLSVGLVDC